MIAPYSGFHHAPRRDGFLVPLAPGFSFPMSTIAFASETEDFRRGFIAGLRESERMDDEIACIEVLFGGKTEVDLSERQLKLLRTMSGNGFRRTDQ